jgi:ATP-dependent Clp protease ATP-binding subunit ClpA
LDPHAVVAERDGRSTPAPTLDPTLQRALTFAGDDAARLGQPDVRPENLLLGLLRAGGPPLFFLKEGRPDMGRLDVERFRAELADRVAPTDIAGRPALPMHADAQAALEAATGLAKERRAESGYGLHLLHALTRVASGPVAELLARYGVSAATVNAELEKWL